VGIDKTIRGGEKGQGWTGEKTVDICVLGLLERDKKSVEGAASTRWGGKLTKIIQDKRRQGGDSGNVTMSRLHGKEKRMKSRGLPRINHVRG